MIFSRMHSPDLQAVAAGSPKGLRRETPPLIDSGTGQDLDRTLYVEAATLRVAEIHHNL